MSREAYNPPDPAVSFPLGIFDAISSIDDCALNKKHQEHLDYLDQISQGNDLVVNTTTANLARSVWMEILCVSNNRMPVPAACTGPDGQILYAWDKGRHHLEVEIFADQPAEFFYRDSDTGELWGEDHAITGGPLPSEVAEKLELFI